MKKKWLDKKKVIFYLVFILLAISTIYAVVMMIQTPSGTSTTEHEHVKSDYVLMILQCVAGMIIIFLPKQVEQKFDIEIPDTMEIFFFLFLFCAIYLGEVRNFYYKIPFWDMILHGFSAAMLGALGFIIVAYLNRSQRITLQLSPFFISLFAFCFATTVGLFWEVYEFLADHLLGTNMQKFMTGEGKVLSGHEALIDTMKDCIVNMLGALIVVSWGYIHLKHQEKRLNNLSRVNEKAEETNLDRNKKED